MKTHTQVNLVKNNIHYTCWIPSDKVELGKIVELQDIDHNGQKYFDDGWEIVGVGQKMDSSFVLERERDHKDFKARIK